MAFRAHPEQLRSAPCAHVRALDTARTWLRLPTALATLPKTSSGHRLPFPLVALALPLPPFPHAQHNPHTLFFPSTHGVSTCVVCCRAPKLAKPWSCDRSPATSLRRAFAACGPRACALLHTIITKWQATRCVAAHSRPSIGRDGDAARAEPVPMPLVLRSVLRSGVRQIALTRRELQN